ncbi:hypothetical protein GCM10011586_32730 [Silvibacterium dinghuense]|nr:hypothetical protein GCM10011586_32730 [Silvibacterium dinghuense]
MRPVRRPHTVPRRVTFVLSELGKFASLLLSLLSLESLLGSAFLVPGMGWEDRLLRSLGRIVLAGCVCFASGLLFEQRPPGHGPGAGILRTLPVRLYLWSLAGMAILFVLSWYLVTYYLPTIWKNQPY